MTTEERLQEAERLLKLVQVYIFSRINNIYEESSVIMNEYDLYKQINEFLNGLKNDN